ncbi:MAG: trypsin-like peptidase domain-containing protein [Bacteroidetes bacterium]|nr:trypsin-like peptidase domain-containing protein [Bacteroidota bacterium]MCW5894791.1 trypsin-like peptidase domain-containing protein [Bacteroidota bacterium]
MKAFDNQQKEIAFGSGFLVRPDEVATNFHVVKGASDIVIRFVNNTDEFKVIGVVGIDIKHDLVVLRLATPNGNRPLVIGNSDNARVGDDVYVAGNPIGLEGTLSKGIISARRGDKHIQLTAPISPGSSGSPVLDRSGSVVAIATALLGEGQNLNFAVPSNHLKKLLKHLDSVQTLGSLAPIPRCDGLYKSEGHISKGTVSGGEYDGQVHIDELWYYFRFYEDGTVVFQNTSAPLGDVIRGGWFKKGGRMTLQSRYEIGDDSSVEFLYNAGTELEAKYLFRSDQEQMSLTVFRKGFFPETFGLLFVKCDLP